MTPEPHNHLLRSFSEPLRRAILHAATPVQLPIRKVLYTAVAVPTHLYFLNAGMASVVVHMNRGGTTEVLMTGTEGLTGASFLLGPQLSSAECFMQVIGDGLRVPLKTLQDLFATSVEFRDAILLQIQSALHISMQSTACASQHEAEARLARWLLVAADLAETENIRLTQEFLAEMLGAQRTTVALVAGQLRKAGLIDYTRGKVAIIDRAGLSQVACECYAVNVSTRAALPRS